MRRKFATAIIVLSALLALSCSDIAYKFGTYDTFLSASTDTSAELHFEKISNYKLYVAHVGENKWNYGSAFDIEGDTFFMNGNIWCKYVDEDSHVKLLNLSDPAQLYLITLDSNGIDTLFHYKILTDRGKRLNVPRGKEYAIIVYHKKKGIVGMYLLIHPNRETNSTNKDVAAYVRGSIGLMDTSKVTVYFPEQISNNIE